MASPEGQTVQIGDGLVLETKTEDGDGAADRAQAQAGSESISLSRYRVGTSLVGWGRSFGPQPGGEFFG